MYQFNNNRISSAEETITASMTSTSFPETYSFQRLTYPDIYIPNRGAAWGIYLRPEDSEEKIRLKKEVENYNAYISHLDHIDGFKQLFISRNFCISKEEIAEHWSIQIAEEVFSKRSFIFQTDLRIIGNYLIDASIPVTYSVLIDKVELSLPIGKDSNAYPTTLGEQKIIWNWTDNGHDFCLFLWDLLGAPYWENEEAEDDEDAVHYSFDAYDQFRYEEPEIQLVRVFSKLENLGYIKTITVIPERNDPRWNHFCKSDGSLDCAVVDTSFLKNALVMEQIHQLLWTPTHLLKDSPYFLTSKTNSQYLSNVPGKYGGHKKLKIYGKLDCPSAARYLAKGQYAKNRVFFIDEATAIAAGYRPCAVCMPEEYKKWKALN